MPSLDRKCSLTGCWYCRDLCHNCMQPGPTPYGAAFGETPLKFCSSECKDLWFHDPDHRPFHAVTLTQGSGVDSQKTLAVLTCDCKKTEEIYISTEDAKCPYIIWYQRGFHYQALNHFSITNKCYPLKKVWNKYFSTAEIESASNTDAIIFQSKMQHYLSQAATCCGYEDIDTFLHPFARDSKTFDSGKFIKCTIIIVMMIVFIFQEVLLWNRIQLLSVTCLQDMCSADLTWVLLTALLKYLYISPTVSCFTVWRQISPTQLHIVC